MHFGVVKRSSWQLLKKEFFFLFASFVTVCSFFFNYALKFCEKKVKDVDKVSTPQTGVFIVVTVEKKKCSNNSFVWWRMYVDVDENIQ